MHSNGENKKRGLKTAIAILAVSLILIILYFGYNIFYPFISKYLFISDETLKQNKKVQSEIIENKTGYIVELTDKLIELTNTERKKAGLKPLQKHEKAETVAKYKVLEMAELGYFDHYSPKYGDIENQFLQFGGIVMNINASMIGENLAMFEGYDKNDIKPEDIITAWMNSPEHKENIVKKEYNSIGIAVYYTKDKKCYAAQEFLMAT